MRLDERLVLKEFRALVATRKLIADSSALILLGRLGLLDACLTRFRLSTIPEVLAECAAGPAGPDDGLGGLSALATLPPLSDPGYAGLPTDRKLVAQALALERGLLAEDRRILQAAEEAGLGALACPWVLTALEQAGLINRKRALACRERLAGEYRYDRLRLSWHEAFCVLMDKGEL